MIGHSRAHPLACSTRSSGYAFSLAPLAGDWVQNTATATTKWGEIGDWDVSGVKDFGYAFSKHRNNAGGSRVLDGNPKAEAFVGTGMSKWITTSVTSLKDTFYGSSVMNADLSKWSVAKVTTMENTFCRTGGINADLSKWSVAMVTTMEKTFYGASKFTGAGLDSWNTEAVTSLLDTFSEAGEMNADLTRWKVDKVTSLENTFKSASKFTGAGLDLWDVSKVTSFSSAFSAASSLTACNKRKIVDAWEGTYSFKVTTTYRTDSEWASATCPVRFE